MESSLSESMASEGARLAGPWMPVFLDSSGPQSIWIRIPTPYTTPCLSCTPSCAPSLTPGRAALRRVEQHSVKEVLPPQRARFHSPSAPARRATAATALLVGSICKRARGARFTSGRVGAALPNAVRDGEREVLPHSGCSSPSAHSPPANDASAHGTPCLHRPPANANAASRLACALMYARQRRFCTQEPRPCALPCDRVSRLTPMRQGSPARVALLSLATLPSCVCIGSRGPVAAYLHPPPAAETNARPRLRYGSVHSVLDVPCPAVQRGTCGRCEERSKEEKTALEEKVAKRARNTKQRERKIWSMTRTSRYNGSPSSAPSATRRCRTCGSWRGGRENTRGREITLRMARARAGDVGRGLTRTEGSEDARAGAEGQEERCAQVERGGVGGMKRRGDEYAKTDTDAGRRARDEDDWNRWIAEYGGEGVERCVWEDRNGCEGRRETTREQEKRRDDDEGRRTGGVGGNGDGEEIDEQGEGAEDGNGMPHEEPGKWRGGTSGDTRRREGKKGNDMDGWCIGRRVSIIAVLFARARSTFFSEGTHAGVMYQGEIAASTISMLELRRVLVEETLNRRRAARNVQNGIRERSVPACQDGILCDRRCRRVTATSVRSASGYSKGGVDRVQTAQSCWWQERHRDPGKTGP
ncbi:hypothetical protein C8R44DRAFT_738979 [Mycena epipterygia]|nr:hypothetical protein C8R44DRAFT_738979 [Mycena epipterygia]